MLRLSKSNNSLFKNLKMAKLHFSAAVATSPRQVIISNLQKLRTVTGAEELQALERYAAGTPSAASDKFEKDPTAWHNMPYTNYIMVEAGREETWPFLVGGVVVFFLFCVALPNALSVEGRKSSKYMSMIEGRHGKLVSDDEHHH